MAQEYGENHNDTIIPEPDSYLREIDLHFAKLMQELSGGKEEVFIASCLISKATGEGHVCLDLTEVAGKKHVLFLKDYQRYELIKCPELKNWCDVLYKSGVVGRPGDYKPLILDDQCRLYLYRYWKYEDILIKELSKRISKRKELPDPFLLKKILLNLFPYQRNRIDLQMLSALIPLMKYLCVITGGPGTGKTTTITKILALLLAFSDKRLHILLAAPTGKASATLKQAMIHIKNSLNIDAHIKDQIPSETFTIHRMLMPLPNTPNFRYNSENRLPADIVVVDEASMVDLPLMSKLIQAIPEDATFIMLGDKNQLSSVEPGSVLGDICAMSSGLPEQAVRSFCSIMDEKITVQNSNIKAPVNECIIELKQNYRFSEKSGIAKLSRAVNKGDAKSVLEILISGDYKDIRFRELRGSELFKIWLKEMILKNYKSYLMAKDPLTAIKTFDSFRILSPIRFGPYGVNQINRLVEEILQEEGLISINGPWYSGRPVIITENNYELGLFNGDVGIIMPDPDSGQLRAFFTDQDGRLRRFLPIMLPAHETVYAMTVHKSQGSEFDNVLFIVPDIYVPVLTRELVYTAITRARNLIEIWGRIEVIEKAVNQRIRRSSGLRDALWGR